MVEKVVNWKRVKLLSIITVLILATVIYMVAGGCDSGNSGTYVQAAAGSSLEEEINDEDVQALDEAENSAQAELEIIVDVGGAVARPGIVMLKAGARVFEAIDAAGGLTQDAETRYINMAEECTDGEKIYITSKEEAGDASFSGAASASIGAASGSGKVNVNTADRAALQTLTGVGPSTASKIIEYREANGSFKSVEDLTKVSGIGEKTLAKFKDSICV